MNILHTITATVNAGDMSRIEKSYSVSRPYKLTAAGAQRVLRAQYRAKKQAHGNLIVTRVETMIDAR